MILGRGRGVVFNIPLRGLMVVFVAASVRGAGPAEVEKSLAAAAQVETEVLRGT